MNVEAMAAVTGLAAPELGMTALLWATVDVRSADSAAAVRDEAICLRAIVEIKDCNVAINSRTKTQPSAFKSLVPSAKIVSGR